MRSLVARIVVVCAMVAACTAAFGQLPSYRGTVWDTNVHYVPYASIRVCPEPATFSAGVCTNLANLYDSAGNPLSNPFPADQYGNYVFFAATGFYTIQPSGPNVTQTTIRYALVPSANSSSTVSGQSVASDFGQWHETTTTPIAGSGSPETVTVTPGSVTLPNGASLVPLTVGNPLAITGDANAETVVPTAVSCASTPCTFTAVFAHAHASGVLVESATAGFAEAATYRAANGGGTVLVDQVTNGYPIPTSLTTPTAVDLDFMKGGILHIASPAVLTIDGSISAGNYQIFDETAGGSVVASGAQPTARGGNIFWFGAVCRGYVDDGTAIQEAVNAFGTAILPQGYVSDDVACSVDGPPVVLGQDQYLTGTAKVMQGIPTSKLTREGGQGPVVIEGHRSVPPATAPSLVSGPGAAIDFSSGNTTEFSFKSETQQFDIAGATAFTAEAFVKLTGTPANGVANIWATSANPLIPHAGWALALDTAGGVTHALFQIGASGGNDHCDSSAALAVGTVYHIALTYDGTTLRGYVGTPGSSETVAACTSAAVSGGMDDSPADQGYFGNNKPDGSGTVPVLVDSARVSNSIRYTLPFTAPSAKFSQDANTLGLINGDSLSNDWLKMYSGASSFVYLVAEANTTSSGGISNVSLGTGDHSVALFLNGTVQTTNSNFYVLKARCGVCVSGNDFFDRFQNISLENIDVLGIGNMYSNYIAGGGFDIDGLDEQGGLFPVYQFANELTVRNPFINGNDPDMVAGLYLSGGNLYLYNPLVDNEGSATNLIASVILNASNSAVFGGDFFAQTPSYPVQVMGNSAIASFSGSDFEPGTGPAVHDSGSGNQIIFNNSFLNTSNGSWSNNTAAVVVNSRTGNAAAGSISNKVLATPDGVAGSFAPRSLTNAYLPNSGSLTINTTGGITGGGPVALGGSLTLNCSSCGTTSFSGLTTGTNSTATMTVAAGAHLTTSAGGLIDATSLQNQTQTVFISGSPASGAGVKLNNGAGPGDIVDFSLDGTTKSVIDSSGNFSGTATSAASVLAAGVTAGSFASGQYTFPGILTMDGGCVTLPTTTGLNVCSNFAGTGETDLSISAGGADASVNLYLQGHSGGTQYLASQFGYNGVLTQHTTFNGWAGFGISNGTSTSQMSSQGTEWFLGTGSGDQSGSLALSTLNATSVSTSGASIGLSGNHLVLSGYPSDASAAVAMQHLGTGGGNIVEFLHGANLESFISQDGSYHGSVVGNSVQSVGSSAVNMDLNSQNISFSANPGTGQAGFEFHAPDHLGNLITFYGAATTFVDDLGRFNGDVIGNVTGNVTGNVSGSAGSVPFSGLTTGTNSTATMTVAAGAHLTTSAGGLIDATSLENQTQTVFISGSPASGAGVQLNNGAGPGDIVDFSLDGVVKSLIDSSGNFSGNAASATACASTNGCWPNSVAAITALGTLTNSTSGNAATASACATTNGCSPVSSVFGRTGAVVLTAADVDAVGAITNSTSGNAATATACASTNGCWPNSVAAITALGTLTNNTSGNANTATDLITGSGNISSTTGGAGSTSAKALMAGTLSGTTAATLCLDANGNATTSGCSGGASLSMSLLTALTGNNKLSNSANALQLLGTNPIIFGSDLSADSSNGNFGMQLYQHSTSDSWACSGQFNLGPSSYINFADFIYPVMSVSFTQQGDGSTCNLPNGPAVIMAGGIGFAAASSGAPSYIDGIVGNLSGEVAVAGTGFTSSASMAPVCDDSGSLTVTGCSYATTVSATAPASVGCSETTVAVSGVTTTMAVSVSPQSDPGTNVSWSGRVSAAGTVAVRLCTLVAFSPGAVTYNIRVLP